jgi:curli biogenesis system outer membrane secretion channel CsgG
MSMTRMRSFSLPIMWALALAIFSGCATDRSSNIPANAIVASSGNDHLSYTAPSYGTIWVYDATNDRIDYSGPIAMNDEVKVEPSNFSVKIDDRVVADKLAQGAQHRIYYLPAQ